MFALYCCGLFVRLIVLDLGCLVYGCLLVVDLMVFVATLVWVFAACCLFSGWVSLAFVVAVTWWMWWV